MGKQQSGTGRLHLICPKCSYSALRESMSKHLREKHRLDVSQTHAAIQRAVEAARSRGQKQPKAYAEAERVFCERCKRRIPIPEIAEHLITDHQFEYAYVNQVAVPWLLKKLEAQKNGAIKAGTAHDLRINPDAILPPGKGRKQSIQSISHSDPTGMGRST